MIYPNIILVSFDALRKDFIQTYNRSVLQATVFERVAEKGIVFHNAFPNGNWTVPSHASIFSGLEPLEHNVYNWNESLTPGADNIFTKAKQLGYRIAFYGSEGVIPIIQNHKHIFDFIGNSWDRSVTNIRKSDRPWIIFWHFLETHAPYGIKPNHKPNLEKLDYVLETDEFNYIRELICSKQISVIEEACRNQLIKASNAVNKLWECLGENTVVMLCSDHGEDWRPYYPFHCSFEEPVLRIPMIACSPYFKSKINNFNLVSHSDMYLLLSYLANWPTEQYDKNERYRKIKNWISDSAIENRVLICGPDSFSNEEVYFALRNQDSMIICQPSKKGYQFYRICKNGNRILLPIESVDVVLLKAAERVLMKCDEKTPYIKPDENPEEIIEHLKQLGYI